jgi:hypothetical protein
MAEFENRLACVIKADGAIARGYMIETCEFDGVNEYVITWKNPLQGAVKTNFSGTIGSALDEPVLPGLITVGRQRIHRRRGCRPLIPAESPLHVLFTSLAFAINNALPWSEHRCAIANWNGNKIGG